jgi:uncharacterized protein
MRESNGGLSFSPSDLNAFLACPHLTALELAVACGELSRPYRANPHADLIRRKGEEHEARHLNRLLSDKGQAVTQILFDDRDWERAARETEEAIRAGADVVYQACLRDSGGQWRGFADFLERRPDGGYEVVDTKLARRAKPAHVLQLCFYTEQLARVQGRWPERMHVVNGLGEREVFRPDDFLAYYRRLQARFLDAVENGRPTYPYPVDHCSLCEFLVLCRKQWERDDHLSLVAGIMRTQVDRLTADDIRTLEALATLPPETKVPKLRAETLVKLSEQAGLQLHRRQTGELKHVLLPLEPERLRPPARALAGRRLARPRGRSLVRPAARARVPARLGLPRRRRGRALRLHLGARPRRGEGRLRAPDRSDLRAAAALSGDARLPLRVVRALGAPAADGRARRA